MFIFGVIIDQQLARYREDATRGYVKIHSVHRSINLILTRYVTACSDKSHQLMRVAHC